MILTPITGNAAAAARRTDAELLGDICADKADALEDLFHRYVRLVNGIAHRILNDRAEAEDVTQDVFLEIYCKAHVYRAERGSVRFWLLHYVYKWTIRRMSLTRL